MSTKLPDIKTHFADWYNEVVYQSELADHSPVRGTIVIRPYGCALWENIRDIVDKKIKATGTQNAIFPLFIPMSFLQKEAKHVEGFSPELAVVTHAGGKELEEALVVRPTSETIIHYMFAKWIKSWRDLPMQINQWANVVRWELRPRPFLRTTEFHWQEGHTAHETAEEAHALALRILHEYQDLIENYLAIPTNPGVKSESEKFAGADKTYTIECMMQDGKALQMGTSHLISQSFAKAFGMIFQNREGQQAYPYLTSWAVTTRLIGAVVMTHGDQKGLILPPKIAPIQVVIIPIFKGENKQEILDFVHAVSEQLKNAGIRIHIDDDEHKTPGAKFYEWELKGVPLRIEIGPRDVQQQSVMVADRLGLEKKALPITNLVQSLQEHLNVIQQKLFERAQQKLQGHWHKGAKITEFGPLLEEQGGFYQTGWCGKETCEQLLKNYKASIRCLLDKHEFDTCFNCDEKSKTDILVAKSY